MAHPCFPHISPNPVLPAVPPCLVSQRGRKFCVQPPLLSRPEAKEGLPLLWLIKGRKQAVGRGLILAQARRHICLLCLCLSCPSCGFPFFSSIIFGESRGYWVEMHGELSGPQHLSNPLSVCVFCPLSSCRLRPALTCFLSALVFVFSHPVL